MKRKSTESLAERLSSQYAKDALLNEREVRGPRLSASIEELRPVQRRKLANDFAIAATQYQKVGNRRLAVRFFAIAARYSPTGYKFTREIAEATGGSSEKPYQRRTGSLERSFAYAVMAAVSLAIALLLISFNLTGAATGNSFEINNWVSIGLFFLGCAFALFYFRIKNKKKL